jgi:hypothetical protein
VRAGRADRPGAVRPERVHDGGHDQLVLASVLGVRGEGFGQRRVGGGRVAAGRGPGERGGLGGAAADADQQLGRGPDEGGAARPPEGEDRAAGVPRAQRAGRGHRVEVVARGGAVCGRAGQHDLGQASVASEGRDGLCGQALPAVALELGGRRGGERRASRGLAEAAGQRLAQRRDAGGGGGGGLVGAEEVVAGGPALTGVRADQHARHPEQAVAEGRPRGRVAGRVAGAEGEAREDQRPGLGRRGAVEVDKMFTHL